MSKLLPLLPYWALLLSISFIAISRWPKLGKADRIISALFIITTVEEPLASFFKRVYGNNVFIYHIYDPLGLLLICLYFDKALIVSRKLHVVAGVGFVSIIISILITVFIEPINKIDSYFLLYEGSVIIALCLLSLYQNLMDEERMPGRFALFWFTICFLLYWSTTWTGWGVFTGLNRQNPQLWFVLKKVLFYANYAFYTGIFLIFFRYKKLIPSDA